MNRTYLVRCVFLAIALSGAPPVHGEDPNVLSELEAAKAELTQTKYRLRYAYQAGEQITYDVEQLVSIDATIGGNNQKTQLRSRSTRTFDVQDVTAEGHMKFAHVIDRVEMWREVSGRQAVKYDSEKGEEPPAEFAEFAKHIGEPISVLTMNPQGQIIDREDKIQHLDVGLGGLSIPLPKAEIRIGHEWSQPLDLRVQLEDKRIKVIKTRELYGLEKVETGVATISVKTQVLTPVDDARVKAQIMQRISRGEIRFDLEAGRLLSKQLDWDESVLGFNGADSNMKYLARFTEKLQPSSPQVARTPRQTK